MVWQDYKVKEQESVQKTLTFDDNSKLQTVIINNLHGGIDVKGYEGREVQLQVKKTIYAYTEQDLQKAKDEVSLNITQEDNTITFYIQSPYLGKQGSSQAAAKDTVYKVRMDFHLKVPQRTHLRLNTQKNGSINIRDINCDCIVEHVKDTIKRKGIRCQTKNAKNAFQRGRSSFKTLSIAKCVLCKNTALSVGDEADEINKGNAKSFVPGQ